MSDDLSIKEEEFHRQNAQLEQRAKIAMKEVDSIVKASGNEVFRSTSRRVSAQLERDTFKLIKRAKVRNTMIDDKSRDNDKDNGTASPAVVQFLEAKIKMLHDELRTVRLDYKEKCDHCRQLEMENKNLIEGKVKFLGRLDTLKDAVTTLEDANRSLKAKFEATGDENATLQKDIASLKKELKSSSRKLGTYDIKLNRLSEDNEKLRTSLKSDRLEGKELRNLMQELQEEKRVCIKKLEKQYLELLRAFEKQMFLISNLKMQKVRIGASKLVSLAEEDFCILLESKSEYPFKT